ncbi:MAG: hypothetical protein QME96_05735 [Myxococcota bacterium]|nr:hypothetical protein [Myxococcota bacterium]
MFGGTIPPATPLRNDPGAPRIPPWQPARVVVVVGVGVVVVGEFPRTFDRAEQPDHDDDDDHEGGH